MKLPMAAEAAEASNKVLIGTGLWVGKTALVHRETTCAVVGSCNGSLHR